MTLSDHPLILTITLGLLGGILLAGTTVAATARARAVCLISWLAFCVLLAVVLM